MIVAGDILLWLGCLISIIGEIMFLVAAFKRSVWWFLGCLFFPVVGLIFLFLNLKTAARPFAMFIGGLLVAGVGAQFAGIGFWR